MAAARVTALCLLLAGCSYRDTRREVSFLHTTKRTSYANGAVIEESGPDRRLANNAIAAGTFIATGSVSGILTAGAADIVESGARALDNVTTSTK